MPHCLIHTRCSLYESIQLVCGHVHLCTHSYTQVHSYLSAYAHSTRTRAPKHNIARKTKRVRHTICVYKRALTHAMAVRCGERVPHLRKVCVDTLGQAYQQSRHQKLSSRNARQRWVIMIFTLISNIYLPTDIPHHLLNVRDSCVILPSAAVCMPRSMRSLTQPRCFFVLCC